MLGMREGRVDRETRYSRMGSIEYVMLTERKFNFALDRNTNQEDYKRVSLPIYLFQVTEKHQDKEKELPFSGFEVQ